MPYNRSTGRMERARSTGHVPIVQNELVQERLRSFRVLPQEVPVALDPELLVDATTLGPVTSTPKWVMSFDGSPQEIAAREQYPSTRLGYVQVAGVLVHLEELLGQERAPLVDPAVIRSATHEALHSMALPGSNVCRQDMATVRDSWRREVFEIIRDYKVEDMPLLDVFMLLVRHSDKAAKCGVVLARCPAHEACRARDIVVPLEGTKCPSCGGYVFPTDALRLHEEVSEEHSNATALGRLMTVLEHVILVSYLHYLFQRQPPVLGSVGFVLDGPLALFGPQAWLHKPLLAFLSALETSLVAKNLACPIIVGIEKSGQFAEHAAAIGGLIPVGRLMRLPDEYIYRHILTFRAPPGAPFGRDTYYGQKFFYKTSQAKMLTITIPKRSCGGTPPDDPNCYPILANSLALLDRLGTSLYEDALIPVALAHNFASIPLRTGTKVLTLMSREALGLSGGPR
ncbi:MAG: hypothetical protein AMXMBFR61_14480 [Fimbriimonadales bacterium]